VYTQDKKTLNSRLYPTESSWQWYKP